MKPQRNVLPTADRLPGAYVNPHQARRHTPTDYENMLGDAIESAFAAGLWELEPLIARLNEECIRTPEGDEWTVDRFKAVMADLASH